MGFGISISGLYVHRYIPSACSRYDFDNMQTYHPYPLEKLYDIDHLTRSLMNMGIRPSFARAQNVTSTKKIILCGQNRMAPSQSRTHVITRNFLNAPNIYELKHRIFSEEF
eukprot:gene16605-5086_t